MHVPTETRKEYFEYVYVIEEETEDGLCLSLQNILACDDAILRDKGEEAAEFIIKNKNCNVRAKYAHEFCSSIDIKEK